MKPSNVAVRLGGRGGVLSLVASAALGLFAGPALAEEGRCLLGTWEGVMRVQRDTGSFAHIVVRMKVSSLERDFKKPEEDQDFLHFGPARRCKVDLSYVVFEDGVHYLAMTNASGGLCERLQNEEVRVKCVSPDKLSVTYQYMSAGKEPKTEEVKLFRKEFAP